MAFRLQLADASDIDEISSVLDRAWTEDPVLKHLMPSVPAQARMKFWGDYMRHALNLPGERLYKIVETDSGNIVAFTKCRYPAKKVQEEKEEESHEGGAPPEGTNVELLAHWMGLLEQYESKYVDPETMYWINIIGTLPEYRKRGLGTQLLKKVLSDAEKDNAKTHLQATAMGKPIYLGLGWTTIDRFEIQTPAGGVVWDCMVHDPRDQKN